MSDLAEIMLNLETVLEMEGWDLPASLFQITGSSEAPELKTLVVLEGHPCDMLQRLWDEGYRMPEGALGLALAVEGWRHLHLDEIEEHLPELWQQMHDHATTTAPNADDEQIKAMMNKAWEAVQMKVRPAQVADEMRVEVRNVLAVLDDQTVCSVSRDRGSEPEVLKHADVQEFAGRVPHYMRCFVAGIRPEDPEE